MVGKERKGTGHGQMRLEGTRQDGRAGKKKQKGTDEARQDGRAGKRNKKERTRQDKTEEREKGTRRNGRDKTERNWWIETGRLADYQKMTVNSNVTTAISRSFSALRFLQHQSDFHKPVVSIISTIDTRTTLPSTIRTSSSSGLVCVGSTPSP